MRAFILGLALFQGAFGGEQISLESRVQALEEKVKHLENRLEAIGANKEGRKKTSPLSEEIALWRSLQKGMSKSEVGKILGTPSRVTEYGVMTNWNYNFKNTRGGYVSFDDDGRLERWSEPVLKVE